MILATPLTAQAQQARKVWRLGFLAPGSSQDMSRSSVLMQTLQALGYVQNQSLLVERRFAEGKIDRLPALAAELVQLTVDVIFTVSTPGVRAAQSATTTIPIVFVGVSDPVGSGLVLSLSRPGANTTGVSTRSEREDTSTPQGNLAARPARGNPLEPRESGIGRIFC